MMTKIPSKNEFDAIVIGSGAGGSAVTYRLVRAGLRVLLVEKGRALPRDGSTLSVRKVIREGAFKSTERWLDRSANHFTPEEYFNVGGKTKWYGAALARFSPGEFHAEPAHDCLGWPIEYADVESYYSEIETLLGIRPLAVEPDLAQIIHRLRRRAPEWRTEPLPMGLAPSIEDAPEEAAHFDGFASAAGLKADGEVSLLSRIADSANVSILTEHAVVSLIGEERRAHRVIGVLLDDGRKYFAANVILCAGAMHSPRLLQRYIAANELQNLPVADSVGRNFKLHILTAVLAISMTRKSDLIRKTTFLLNDRYPHSSAQPLGFDGELIAGLVPRYVPRFMARAIGSRAYGFFLQTEDGSSLDNRIISEAFDRPYPILDYDASRTPAARDEHKAMVAAFCRDLRRAGFLTVSQSIGIHGTAHACGTLRAGNDPHDSVVDADGRVHGFEGLSVADGSILPRSSRVNPALTIYAWGLRVADQIAQRSVPTRNEAPVDTARVVSASGA